MNTRAFKIITGTQEPSRFDVVRNEAMRQATLREGERVISGAVQELSRLRSLAAAQDTSDRLRRVAGDLEALARELSQ